MGEQLGKLLECLFITDISNSPKNQQRIFIDELIKEDCSIPYDYISDHVYKQEDSSTEDNEIFNQNRVVLSKEMENYDIYTEKDIECLEKNLSKLNRHYKLAKLQKKFILRAAKDAEEKFESVKESTTRLTDIVTKTKKTVSEVKSTKASIYTDIIAILGVFSAFIVVMFGGIEIARSLFNIGNDWSSVRLSRIITIGSIMMIIVLTILYSLLLWIAKITDKNFTKCYSKDCKEGCTKVVKHAFYRHAYYIILMALLVISALVSHNFF